MAKSLPTGIRIEHHAEVEVETIGGFCESLESQLVQAEAHCFYGEPETGLKLLKEIWKEYLSFRDVLVVYCGTDLGERIVKSLASASVIVKDNSPITNGMSASANRSIAMA